jgi:hypothetical protein
MFGEKSQVPHGAKRLRSMKSGDQAWSANEEATTGGLMEKVTVGPFTNVKVSIYSDDATLFFLSWEHDDARYHVWIDRHTYTIESDPNYKRRPTLYKNPPHGVRVGMDGYFRLRKLDARKHGIVDTVLTYAKRAGLFEAAIAEIKARERE